MVDIRMKAEGAEELARRYHRAPEAVHREQMRAMEEGLLDAEREVVKRTPTNKRATGGRLKSAIRAAEAKTILYAGSAVRGILAVTNVAYTLWVEEDTKPHVIRAKHGKALAFSPVAGFQKVWRSVTGRVYKTQAKAGPGASEQRGRALYRVQYLTGAEVGRGRVEGGGIAASGYLYTRAEARGTYRVARKAPKGGGAPERLVTRAGASTMIFRTEVHHPGTRGQHMFRDGAKAAWPSVQRRFAAAAARVARRLNGR